MNDGDIKHMWTAVSFADACKPSKESIPKVGAVIAIDNVVIGSGQRGTGTVGDDEHAEYNAFLKVHDKTQLPKATVYTTLEPCTRDVRSKPDECCTELILQANVQKVFIGILDPNQGVRGKGLWELQRRGIQVELFTPEHAKAILALNQNFIRFQQTLGATILTPTPGQEFFVAKGERGGWFGKCDFVCKCTNDPDPSIKVIVQKGGGWWPARSDLHRIGETKEWRSELYFGGEGDHTIHVVKATGAGAILLSHYQDVVNKNDERIKAIEGRLKEKGITYELLQGLPGTYHGIKMGALPKGLESQAHVQVRVVRKT